MTNAERDPSVMVSATVRSHRKILALPSVEARWAYVVCLGEAKLRRPPGRFDDRAVLDYRMFELATQVDDLIRVGLLHVAPLRCRECRERFGKTKPGTIVVHDWHVHQRTSTERVQRHRSKPVSGDAPEPVGNAGETLHTGAHRPSYIADVSPVPDRAGDDDPEWPVLSWLASVNATIQPNGSGYHRELVLLVERQGAVKVLAAMKSRYAAGDRSPRQLLYGASNDLEPINRQTTKPKGLGPNIEEAERAFRS